MLIRGDARHLPLRDKTVDCCVTSPPYFGLRDYGSQNQIGLESTPDAYVAQLVQVFREVRRVLKDDGTLWLNLGSSYVASPRGNKPGDFSTSSLTNPARQDGVSRGSDPTRFLPRRRVLAYGTDGKELQDSTGADFACSDLCDGCLADFLSHRARIAGSDRQTAQSGLLPSQTDRDNELVDSAATSPVASLPDVRESNTLESWLRHRGVCSRCDSRASSLSAARSSFDGVQAFSRMTWSDYTSRLKHKDLIPVPWMVAMALQADGWYLRSDIIWHKPNPMPESVTDRPTKAHEYLFLLTKSQRYYYDSQAIAEPVSAAMLNQMEQGYKGLGLKDYDAAGVQNPSSVKARIIANAVKRSGNKARKPASERGVPSGTGKNQAGSVPWEGITRNKRSVWSINSHPFSGAHFATMPESLVEPCILAGSSMGGLVLDPFIGSGTVGVVAARLGRRWVGTDLAYHDISSQRTAQRGLTWV